MNIDILQNMLRIAEDSSLDKDDLDNFEAYRKKIEYADIDAAEVYANCINAEKGFTSFEEAEQFKQFLGIDKTTSKEELTAIRNTLVKYWADESDEFYAIPRKEHTEEELIKHDKMMDQMQSYTMILDGMIMDLQYVNEDLKNQPALKNAWGKWSKRDKYSLNYTVNGTDYSAQNAKVNTPDTYWLEDVETGDAVCKGTPKDLIQYMNEDAKEYYVIEFIRNKDKIQIKNKIAANGEQDALKIYKELDVAKRNKDIVYRKDNKFFDAITNDPLINYKFIGLDESLHGYKTVAKIIQNDKGFNVAEKDEPMLVKDEPTLKQLLDDLSKYL